MKDNKEFIKGVYEKYEQYKKDENSKWKVSSQQVTGINKKKVAQKVLSYAAAITIAISGVVVTNNYINKNNEISRPSETKTSNKLTLKTVDNFENFYEIAKEYTKTTNNNARNLEYDDSLSINDSDYSKSSSLSPGSINQSTQESSNYSKTNIQVEDVDEADIVKTDGKYIYYVVGKKIIIADISKKDELSQISEIDFSTEKYTPSELYINKNKLIILGNENEYSYDTGITVKETTDSVYKKGIYKQKTVAKIYDLSNIEDPTKERTIEIEGNYVSSRMIDNNIYFIGNKSVNTNNIAKYEIDDLDEDVYKPTYKDTLNSNSEKTIDFDKIYYFDNIESLNYLTLAGFSIDNKKEADIQTFLGAGEDVYSSNQNMYIAKQKNVYDADTHKSLGYDTKILKFNLNNGKIKFKAEADVTGGINNQFSMDENNGYFRIATTVGISSWDIDNDSSSNSLYILDENLKEVGKVEGIAKGEKIYSVRYVGNKAYVVTFKTMDPLFVIDLSDVKKPKILGELKIPGYSTYLHPYDETHLIGFGYDTKENLSEDGYVQNGLKMSMFDITNLNNPKEMFTVKIGKNGTTSPLTEDHKALLFSKEKNIIAFPVNSYKNGKYVSKAQIYKIDLNKGFILQGEIQNSEVSSKNYSYKKTIERIIYSNDVYYTLSKNLIKAVDMETLKEITKLEIE
jgi:inhibitor of cysteine peptidase